MLKVIRRFFVSLLVMGVASDLAAQIDAPGLKFIENKNQWPADIHFSARVPGGNMQISPGKFSYHFVDEIRIEELHELGHERHSEDGSPVIEDETIKAHSVTVELTGANNQSIPQPFGRSTEYYNYFLGSDTCNWASQAYAYEGVFYADMYPGVDMKIYSSGRHLKYDFVVKPEHDPSQIALRYSGADQLYLDNGNLFVKISLGELIEKRPVVFQMIDGKKVDVVSEYHLESDVMTFRFPQGYDPCHELVIDPLLIFSTYSGSRADNWGSTATPGERGNLYSSGVTNHFYGNRFSGEFAKTTGAFQTTYGGDFDIGILKYDSAGKKLLYASYLGGLLAESPHSLLMNANEELVILGTTSSSNFPTTNNAVSRVYGGGHPRSAASIGYAQGSDIFVSRISKDGKQLLASTYLGGTENDGMNVAFGALTKNYGDDLRGDIITDAVGNIYFSSVTSSPNFPLTKGRDTVYNGGDTDAIVMKLNANLTKILWGTFIGGNGSDASHTIKFDQAGNLYVAGGTTSDDFPVTTGSFQSARAGDADGWIAKLNPEGDEIIDATYTGTSSFDQVYFLDLNDVEEVYVYGQTSGTMSVSTGVYGNPGSGQFLQKFSNDLSDRLFTTVFGSGGGLPDISPTAFLVSDCNNIYMSGWGGAVNGIGGWGTTTDDMPVTPDAQQATTSGSDFYFIVLAEDATKLLYATYLGGTESRTHVDGGTSRFDKEGVVYHAVCSGCTFDTDDDQPKSDFPTTPGAVSRSNNSLNCNNAAFKFDLASLRARLEIRDDVTSVCLPSQVVFENMSSGGEVYYYDFGDGNFTQRTNTIPFAYEFKDPGEYTVRLIARDEATCRVSDTTYVKITAHTSVSTVQNDDDHCGGTPYQLKANGGETYHWRSEDGTFESTEEDPIVSINDTTRYFVDIIEASGCTHSDEVTINVVPEINPEFELERSGGCVTRPYITVKSLTDSLFKNDEMFFDFGDGITSDATEIEHYFEKDDLYTVRHVVLRTGCRYEQVMEVPVFVMKIPNVITPEASPGDNDAFSIRLSRDDQPERTPADFGFNVSLLIYNRWGNVVYQSDNYQYDWTGSDVTAGVYYYEATVEGHATCKSWLHVIK